MNNLKLGYVLFAKELKSLLVSKLAWSMMAILQIVISFQFLAFVEKYIEVQQLQQNLSLNVMNMIIVPLYGAIAIILLLITPILTMRQISGEFKNRTMSLLLSSPLSVATIVIAKFLSVCCFLYLCVFFLSFMPLSLMLGAAIDVGQIIAAILGLLLCVSAFVALGFFLSSLTKQPSIAAISSLGLLLLLWLINITAQGVEFNGLAYLSPLQHLQYFILGSVETEHMSFFALFCGYFISLTIIKLTPN